MYKLRNTKKRIFNGVKPEELITIKEESRKDLYLRNGFVIVSEIKEESKVEQNQDTPERQELEELYKLYFGKAPSSKIKIETLREKIKEQEESQESD